MGKSSEHGKIRWKRWEMMGIWEFVGDFSDIQWIFLMIFLGDLMGLTNHKPGIYFYGCDLHRDDNDLQCTYFLGYSGRCLCN